MWDLSKTRGSKEEIEAHARTRKKIMPPELRDGANLDRKFATELRTKRIIYSDFFLALQDQDYLRVALAAPCSGNNIISLAKCG